MSNHSPLMFQQKAIDSLTDIFIELWKKDGRQLPIVFKSPTGSGKTLMTAHLVRGLNRLSNWDADKSFIWITFSEELALQSKAKFEKYFKNALENQLLTVNDINRGKLKKNDILFINWQKIVSRAAENRILRRPDDEMMQKESGKYFEDMIDGTHKEKREIILIIDESHRNATTALSQEMIDYINPKIIINVSATPNNDAELNARRLNSFYEVPHESVVVEGLIKEKILIQTDEDLKKFKGKDLDEVLLTLGIEKRKELKSEFESIGKNINPLLLIQLPNDDNKLIDMGQKTKEEVVLDFLYNQGVKEEEIALWFDGKKERMENISENYNPVNYMLFKQAAGTGWDCPRAHVLVMFREINSATFYVQTVGRILRMPEPKLKDDYKNNPNLRTGYLFTNYSRNEVGIPNQSKDNPPRFLTALRKKNIDNICLQSSFISRVDYGDLSNSIKFQASFVKSMNSYFGINEEDILDKAQNKLIDAGIEIAAQLTNQIIVDAEFDDFDQLGYEFANKGRDLSLELSRNDVEKTFNYLCFQLLKEQTEETAKITNLSRSWGPLKSGLRVWLKSIFGDSSDYFYRILINDIRKDASSIFRPAITQALKEYKPILEEILAAKKEKNESKGAPIFTIQEEYSYSESHEEIPAKLCVLDKFYLLKDYSGRENELEFKDYIDIKDSKIEWWFKNGDYGKEYYAIKYFNTNLQREALFYPDWIIKFKSGKIGIFDTKKGNTASSTEGRAEALANKLVELGSNYVGGIAIKENGVWYYNSSSDYEYAPGKLNNDWKKFEDLLKTL